MFSPEVLSTVGELHLEAKARLSRAPFELDRRESALLLGHVLGWNEAQVLARSEQRVAAAERERFFDLVERRRQGEPVAYLFGEREFYGRPFAVDSRVLIPRPETEHAVAAVLDRNLGPGSRLIDVGCGSGCIALTLALERPDLSVFACDLSLDALAVTRKNRRLHGLDLGLDFGAAAVTQAGPNEGARSQVRRLVQLVAGDLIEAIDLQTIDLIVSNLPYVDPRDASLLSPEIRNYEPATALFAERGLALIGRLLNAAHPRLRPGCALVLEIGAGQLEAVLDLARGFTVDRVRHDYSGHERIVELVRNDEVPSSC